MSTVETSRVTCMPLEQEFEQTVSGAFPTVVPHSLQAAGSGAVDALEATVATLIDLRDSDEPDLQ